LVGSFFMWKNKGERIMLTVKILLALNLAFLIFASYCMHRLERRDDEQKETSGDSERD
jgi:hypothetical protein